MHFVKPYNDLPKHIPYLELSCYTRAARDLSGDFFYHHHINDDECVLILGDVSGKGMLASYHTEELKSRFQKLFENQLGIEEFLIQTNRFISRRFDKHIFVTLFYLYINSSSRQLQFARAGQCPPIFYTGEKDYSFYLHERGMGLGFFRDDSVIDHIDISEREYEPGDLLFIYSDGLTENTHPETKEEFGYQRLLATFMELDKSAHPELLTQALLREHENFIGSKKLNDDTSLMLVKFM